MVYVLCTVSKRGCGFEGRGHMRFKVLQLSFDGWANVHQVMIQVYS